MSYVLMTAAKNEESYIGAAINAVVRQTVRPLKWVIVNDGSTDSTEAIVSRYLAGSRFIDRMKRESSRHGFDQQALALNLAFDSLRDCMFEFVGCLDADITFDQNYYEQLIERFRIDPELGIAGGWIMERDGHDRFVGRTANRERSVPGAIQFFRRECFEQIGGFLPLPHGGLDTHAEFAARKSGWKVRSFCGIPAYHNRPSGSVGVSRAKSLIRQGKREFSVGYHPLYTLAKALRRIGDRPFVIGSFCVLLGFVKAALTERRRVVPQEFVAYVRQQQLQHFRSVSDRFLRYP